MEAGTEGHCAANPCKDRYTLTYNYDYKYNVCARSDHRGSARSGVPRANSAGVILVRLRVAADAKGREDSGRSSTKH